MMRWLARVVWILALVFQNQVHALESFDPYKHNGSCTSSMSMCSFELHATAAMTMFYKNFFRIVADENGRLRHYDDFNQTFTMEDVLTGDGYPKLVRILFSVKS